VSANLPAAAVSGTVGEHVPPVNDDEIARLPQIGDVVASKYRITEMIGQGGMGVVFAGLHEALQQPVAIKFLRPSQAKDGESLKRFLQEARAAASLRNARAARVFDIDSTPEGVPFIVMERLEGDNVDRVLELRGAFAVGAAVDCVLQVCEALAEAHAAGLVHRDLKPSNLFLLAEPGGVLSIKVLDFGISKAIAGQLGVSQTSLTGPNTVLGSPQYMSPEQVMSKPVDPRTDIWALGAILFEFLTLRSPFEADSVPHLYAMIVSSPPLSLRTLMPKAPAKLESAILRCLEKSPANRPQDVGELAALLAPFASKDGATSVARVRAALEKGVAGRASVPSPASGAAPVSRRLGASIEFEPTMPAGAVTRSRVGAALGAALATAAVLVAVVVVWRGAHSKALRGPGVAASAPATTSAPASSGESPATEPSPSPANPPGATATALASASPSASAPAPARAPTPSASGSRVRDLHGIKLLQ
jgi:serine/threonine-protein kinase